VRTWRATGKLLTLGIPIWAILVSVGLLAFGAPKWTILIVAGALAVVALFAGGAKAPPGLPPPWHAYTSDEVFDGVECHWSWRDGMQLDRFAALCRFDQNELVGGDFLGLVKLNCTHCGRSWQIGHVPEGPTEIAAREIRRRWRAGLWQGAADRLRVLPDPRSGRGMV
jgi:hypothetical protein